MNQLTVRGFDRALARRIREVAKARGLSLNQAVVLCSSARAPGWRPPDLPPASAIR